MPVNFLQQRKRQKFLAPIILVILGLTFIILWFGYFKKEEAPSTEVGVPTPVLQEIKINFEVLENPLLKELQPFEEITSYQGLIGRENPFLPY